MANLIASLEARLKAHDQALNKAAGSTDNRHPMAGIRDKLMPFLDRAAKRPFVWGQSDCMLEVADWLDHACGLDAASRWRGTYSDEAGAIAAMGGDIGTAMRQEAARLGLSEAAEPLPGDVALVTLPGQEKPLGAILMPSGRWRMKTLSGILLTKDVTVIVAWSLPCRP